MALSFLLKKYDQSKIQLLIYNLFDQLWSAFTHETLYVTIKILRSNRELKMLFLWMRLETFSQ